MEDLHGTVVHAHGNGHLQLPLRPAQELVRCLVKSEGRGSGVQLLLCDLEGIEFCHMRFSLPLDASSGHGSFASAAMETICEKILSRKASEKKTVR